MARTATATARPEPFDRVLESARRQEAGRLRRFELLWIVRCTALLFAAALIVNHVAVFTTDGVFASGHSAWAVLGSGAMGFILGYVIIIGLGGIFVVLIPIALSRLLASGRTDDLAGFERREHDPVP